MRDLRESHRRGGFYWHENEPYVSVTTVLGVLDKPALKFWLGREIYRAVCANPTLSEKEALAAPYRLSKKAMSRGTAIHSIVENYKHTQKYLKTVPEDFRGYAEAFYRFMEDANPEVLSNERTVLSENYGYAGTLDLLLKFKKSGRIFIVDIKTGKDVYDEAFLQLSAYKQALYEQDKQVCEMAVLLLGTGTDGNATGKYKFAEGDYCFDEFLACKKLWEWKNADLIRSVNGYKKGGEKSENNSHKTNRKIAALV